MSSNIAKTYILGSLVLLGVCLGQPAHAIVLSSISTSTYGNPSIYNSLPTVGLTGADVGKSFGVNWTVPSTVTGLSTDLVANGLFKVVSFDSHDLILDATITDATQSTFQAAVMSLALGIDGVDPDPRGSIVQAGSIFSAVGTGNGPHETFPGGFKNIDACVYNAAAHGCSGTSINDGLLDGYGGTHNTDSFRLKLTSTKTGGFGNTPSATIGALGLKWQTQGGSYEVPGSPFLSVPEPSTPWLFMAGMAGLLAYRRRRARLPARH